MITAKSTGVIIAVGRKRTKSKMLQNKKFQNQITQSVHCEPGTGDSGASSREAGQSGIKVTKFWSLAYGNSRVMVNRGSKLMRRNTYTIQGNCSAAQDRAMGKRSRLKTRIWRHLQYLEFKNCHRCSRSKLTERNRTKEKAFTYLYMAYGRGGKKPRNKILKVRSKPEKYNVKIRKIQKKWKTKFREVQKGKESEDYCTEELSFRSPCKILQSKYLTKGQEIKKHKLLCIK